MKQTKNPSSLKRSSQKLSQANISMRPTSNFFSTTQSLLPIKTPMQSSSTSSPHTVQQLYQTIGSTGNNFQWKRPQSKHGCRRMMNRPETAKGMRTAGRTDKYPSMNNCSSSSVINPSRFRDRNKETKKVVSRNQLPSKSMYQHQGMQDKENKSSQCEDDMEIEIVINRKNEGLKGGSVYGNKFETELPEDFLALFAN